MSDRGKQALRDAFGDGRDRVDFAVEMAEMIADAHYPGILAEDIRFDMAAALVIALCKDANMIRGLNVLARPEPATADGAASENGEKTGWQADGAYVPCPQCGWVPAPHTGPGIPLRIGGTTHKGTCPTIPRPRPEQAAALQARLEEMRRARQPHGTCGARP